jgi:hypothetical protein
VTTSFTISTDRVGCRRWWLVRVYDDVEAMRRAGAAYDPSVDFSQCYACCQAAVWRDDTGAIVRFGAYGYAGVIRFCSKMMTSEVVAHELVHAAVAVYRMNVVEDVRLGKNVGEREEQLAYIYGDLYASFEAAFHRQPARLPPVT